MVSPLGFGLGETLGALRARTGLRFAVTRFPVEHCRCKTAGQVADARLTGAGEPLLRPSGFTRRPNDDLALGEALAQAPLSNPSSAW